MSAQVISQVGDWVQWVTVLVYIYETTHSGMALSSVFIAMTVTRVVMSPLAGAIVDRVDRRKAMIYTSFGQGILVCVLFGLLRADLLGLSALLVLVTAISILSTVYEPTKRAVIPMIVAKDEILAANSMMEVFMNAVWVLGPVTGGGIVTLAGFGAGFILNAFTFFASGSLICLIRLEYKTDGTSLQSKTILRDIKEGFHYIRVQPVVLSLILADFIMMFGAGAVNSQTPSLPQEVYHIGAEIGYPFLLSTVGIGWVVGSLVLVRMSPSLKGTQTKFLLWIFSRAGGGITIILIAHLTNFYFGCCIWFVHGVLNSFHDTVGTTVVQETCDPKFLGRVFSTAGLLMETASLISISLGGILHDVYGIVLVYNYAGSVEIVSILTALIILYITKSLFFRPNPKVPPFADHGREL